MVLYYVLTRCQNADGGMNMKKNIGPRLALYPVPITVITVIMIIARRKRMFSPPNGTFGGK